MSHGSYPQSGRSLILKRAFTLIELLVVIAIIAILAAILFPVFAQAKQAAKTTAAISNVKQLSLGHLMYAGDNDDIAMLPWQQCCANPAVQGPRFPVQILYPYTKNIDIVWDPAVAKPNFARPMTDPFWGAWTTYGTISWSNQGLYYDGPTGSVGRNLSAQEDNAKRMILISNSRPQSGLEVGELAVNATEQSCYDKNADWTNSKNRGTKPAADKWHSGAYVSGYMDGHAGKRKGVVFETTNCGQKGYDFWMAGNSSGDRWSAKVNDWAQFYLSEDKIAYWGTYWDSTR